MPLYDLRCEKCDTIERDVYHAMAVPHPACPACGSARCHVPGHVMLDRYFHGDEALSRRWYIHPDNIEAARRDMPEVAQCIGRDGVRFAGRSEEREFRRALERSSQRAEREAEQDAEIEQKIQ